MIVFAGVRFRNGEMRVRCVVAPAVRAAHDARHEIVGDLDRRDHAADAVRHARRAYGSCSQRPESGR